MFFSTSSRAPSIVLLRNPFVTSIPVFERASLLRLPVLTLLFKLSASSSSTLFATPFTKPTVAAPDVFFKSCLMIFLFNSLFLYLLNNPTPPSVTFFPASSSPGSIYFLIVDFSSFFFSTIPNLSLA